MRDLTLLVSTMDCHLAENRRFFESAGDIPILVINQLRNPDGGDCTRSFKNTEIITFHETGLSRSRNRAMQHCSTTYGLLCDDDITMHATCRTIVDIFDSEPDLGFITFRHVNENGEFTKKYGKNPFYHSKTSVRSVTSIDVALNLPAVRSSSVLFDERFGLGAMYPIGEESIFLTDLINAGIRGKYVPITLASHFGPTTGKRFDKETAYARGAYYRRKYKTVSLVYMLVHIVRKARFILEAGSPFEYMRSCMAGYRSFGRDQQPRSD